MIYRKKVRGDIGYLSDIYKLLNFLVREIVLDVRCMKVFRI